MRTISLIGILRLYRKTGRYCLSIARKELTMNTFQLKTMAAFFMLLDHIAYFFPNMPIVFRWIGRVSAPVFMFCLVIGMRYTSSKEKYLLRLYIASVGMSMFQMISGVELNFFRTLFVTACVIYILDKRKDKYFRRYVWGYIAFQIVASGVCVYLTAISNADTESFCFYVLPAISGCMICLEGGMLFASLGVVFFFCINDKRQMIVSYSLYTLMFAILTDSSIVWRTVNIISGQIQGYWDGVYEIFCCVLEGFVGISPMGTEGGFLVEQYQWMSIFALLLFLAFNGEKGLKVKYSFYVFYPAHIIILWLLSITLGGNYL